MSEKVYLRENYLRWDSSKFEVQGSEVQLYIYMYNNYND